MDCYDCSAFGMMPILGEELVFLNAYAPYPLFRPLVLCGLCIAIMMLAKTLFVMISVSA